MHVLPVKMSICGSRAVVYSGVANAADTMPVGTSCTVVYAGLPLSSI